MVGGGIRRTEKVIMGADNFFAGIIEAILALFVELLRIQFSPIFTLIEHIQQFMM